MGETGFFIANEPPPLIPNAIVVDGKPTLMRPARKNRAPIVVDGVKMTRDGRPYKRVGRPKKNTSIVRVPY